MEKQQKQVIGKRKVGEWDVVIEYDPEKQKSFIHAKKTVDNKVVEELKDVGIPDGMSDGQLKTYIETLCLGPPKGSEMICPMCQGTGKVTGLEVVE